MNKVELLKEELKKASPELLNNVAFRNYINNSISSLQQDPNNGLKIVVDRNKIEILEQGKGKSFGEEIKVSKVTTLELAPDGLFHVATSLAEYRNLESKTVHGNFLYKKESYEENGIKLAEVNYSCNNKLDNFNYNQIDNEIMLHELKSHEPDIQPLRSGFSQQVPSAGDVAFNASYKVVQRDLNNLGVVNVFAADLPNTFSGKNYGGEYKTIQSGIFPINFENPVVSLNYVSEDPIVLNGLSVDNEEIENRINLANQELLNELKQRPSSVTTEIMIDKLSKQLGVDNKVK